MYLSLRLRRENLFVRSVAESFCHSRGSKRKAEGMAAPPPSGSVAAAADDDGEAPIEVALFRARFEAEVKLARLEYRNKDWLDVVRKAIDKQREDDSDSDSGDEAAESKASKSKKSPSSGGKKPASSRPPSPSRRRSRSGSSDITQHRFGDVEGGPQNYGGVSLKEARALVRRLYGTERIKEGLVLKLFDPARRTEVKGRQDLVAVFGTWEAESRKRWVRHHVHLTLEAVASLTEYAQNDSIEDFRPSATPQGALVSDASSNEDHRHEQRHELALSALGKLRHCMDIDLAAVTASTRDGKHGSAWYHFLRLDEWEQQCRRAWHHLLRVCRASSNYTVVTTAADLLVRYPVLFSFCEEHRSAPGAAVAAGSAFLAVLVRHGASESAANDPLAMHSALVGLTRCNFADVEDFFHRPRPFDASAVAHPLIVLLGAVDGCSDEVDPAVNAKAAEMTRLATTLLASCLRLARPDELSTTIREMILRPERRSFMLGLRLVVTMATSAEGRRKLWSMPTLFVRAVAIGQDCVHEMRTRGAQGRGAGGDDGMGEEDDEKSDVAVMRRVAQALLTFLETWPSRDGVFLTLDKDRRESFISAVPLLLDLAQANVATGPTGHRRKHGSSITPASACGALATLAASGLLQDDADNNADAAEVLLALIELPAALGVTERAAVTLCNMVVNNVEGEITRLERLEHRERLLLLASRCSLTLAVRARNRCERGVQVHVARTVLLLARRIALSASTDRKTGTSAPLMQKTARAMLAPLGPRESAHAVHAAIEDALRACWTVSCSSSPFSSGMRRHLVSSGAVSLAYGIARRSLDLLLSAEQYRVSVAKREKRQKRRELRRLQEAKEAQEEEGMPAHLLNRRRSQRAMSVEDEGEEDEEDDTDNAAALTLTAAEEDSTRRVLCCALGLLFLLCTTDQRAGDQGQDPVPSIRLPSLLAWCVPLAVDLLRSEQEAGSSGRPRTLVLALLHGILANRHQSDGHGTNTPRDDEKSDGDDGANRALTSMMRNTALIDGLLAVASGTEATTQSTQDGIAGVWERVQALAVLDHLDMPATTTASNAGAGSETYAEVTTRMLSASSFLASGHAAALLSRWALQPKLKRLLRTLQSGPAVVGVVRRATRVLVVQDEATQATQGREDGQVLSALVSAVRASRNLAVHQSFQKSLGAAGAIDILSRALVPLSTAASRAKNTAAEWRHFRSAAEDCETALYCLGRNPCNLLRSYKVALRTCGARLRCEEEEAVRRLLSLKSSLSQTVKRRVIDAGGTSSNAKINKAFLTSADQKTKPDSVSFQNMRHRVSRAAPTLVIILYALCFGVLTIVTCCYFPLPLPT